MVWTVNSIFDWHVLIQVDKQQPELTELTRQVFPTKVPKDFIFYQTTKGTTPH